ncbi:uncharacterized protein B0P05DRAFT_517661 [Gilbertella persicaria]|uniref:uncharacterized protein n=1 Tax=Gilbertella persicaria TaxID=101096 RepID=UPI00222028B3|nr:uncharacterized protein B0P05DRAFT_517661 [Gilbertella persicaria]KAI8056512.1 hypothetical protein B0P05DRAFT_517661 [Gilbertella persicaria]
MSTQNLKDKEDLILPLKWKPGEDRISKLLLGDPKIINLVVHSLVDASIPANSYIPAQAEWTDGSRLDVVYASPIKTTESLPPILIELQYQVDQDFMLRLITYASHTYKRYKVLPIILVIVTKSLSSADFQREFTISRNGLLLEASCNSNKYWSKSVIILFSRSIQGIYTLGISPFSLGWNIAIGRNTCIYRQFVLNTYHIFIQVIKYITN